MDNKYPKILIIGETFHSNSGGGITLSNLFKDWPSEAIANAVDFKADPSKEFAQVKYFELHHHKKIFKIFSVTPFSNFSTNALKNTGNNRKALRDIKKFIKRSFYWLLDKTNLKHVTYSYSIDSELLDWIKDFNPDFIYSQLSNRELINLVSKLKQQTQIPLAIHIMDDWPTTIGGNGLFSLYWNNKINKELRALLNQTTVFLSISEAMSKEYKSRYNKTFSPFHNPLDLEKWDIEKSKENDEISTVKFLHAGRIGTGISKSILTLAQTIEEIGETTTLSVKFILQSSNIDPIFKSEISKYSCVEIPPPADYEEIPKILKSATALIICNDFDKKEIEFLKYSMPTKASEYMISKVPVLIFSDSKSAISEHALTHNWAIVVGENDVSILKNALLNIVTNQHLRKTLSLNAYAFAKENFDGDLIREKFRSIFTQYAKR